jgi:type I restriction enzyme S subunit
VSNSWRWTTLSELLLDLTVSRSFAVDPNDEITNPTISSADHTILPAGKAVSGEDVLVSKRVRIEPGDLVFSRLHTQNGAFAYADRRFEATTTFIPFKVLEDKVDRRFLFWALHKFVPSLSTSDTVGRETFKTADILALKIPVITSVPNQRIVAREIDELATAAIEATRLHRSALKDAQDLYSAVLFRSFTGQLTADWRTNNQDVETADALVARIYSKRWPGHGRIRKRQRIDLPAPPDVPKTWLVADAGLLQESGVILDIQDGNHGSGYPRKSEFSVQGVPFVTARQITNGGVDIAAAPKLPRWRAEQLRIGFAQSDDVLLTHNASVGDVAILPRGTDGLLIGTSVTYWRCNCEALEPRFLYYFMLSSLFQDQLRYIMKQTTRNQVSVLKQVNLWICLPPLNEQREIARLLDDLRSRLTLVYQFQEEAGIHLRSLLPAILGRIFPQN